LSNLKPRKQGPNKTTTNNLLRGVSVVDETTRGSHLPSAHGMGWAKVRLLRIMRKGKKQWKKWKQPLPLLWWSLVETLLREMYNRLVS
jgi:hypothetical protein